MVSNDVRHMIWNRLLDMSRYDRYYDRLSSRYRRYQHIFQFLLALSATSVLVSFIEILPKNLVEIPIVLAGALVGVVVVFDLVYKPGDKAAVLTILSREVSQLAGDYRDLWEKTSSGQLKDEEATKESDIIFKMVSNILRYDSGVDDKINQRCTEDAYIVEQRRYAAQTT